MISRRTIKRCSWAVAAIAAAVYLVTALRAPSDVDITAAIRSTIIPRLSLSDEPLDQVVETVLSHVSSQHPRIGHIPSHVYVHDFDDSSSRPLITLVLRDDPADKALLTIANLSNNNWTTREGAVYLYPISACGGGTPLLTYSDRLAFEWKMLKGRFRSMFQ